MKNGTVCVDGNHLDYIQFGKGKQHLIMIPGVGDGLLVAIMIPNFIWMAKPAPNDILSGGSLTPVLDGIICIFRLFLSPPCAGSSGKRKRVCIVPGGS